MKKTRISILIALFVVLTMVIVGCSSEKSKSQPAKSPEASSKAAPAGTKYPEKNIQVVIGYAPGGDSDLNARLTMKYLEKELGKQLIAVNTDGAGGGTASRKVKDAAPDGYTAYFTQISLMMNYALKTSDLTYTNFEVAGMVCLDEASVLLTHADSKYKTLEDVISDAKARPGKVMYSSYTGSDTSLRVKLLEKAAGIKFNEVDTGGTAARVTALLGKQTDIMSVPFGSVKDYVESKQFRVLGVYGSERISLIPDVPTFKEKGFDVIVPKYFFYVFPPKTPDDVVNRFSEALEKVCANPQMKEELWKYYVKPVYMNRKDTTDTLKKLQDEYIELLRK